MAKEGKLSIGNLVKAFEELALKNRCNYWVKNGDSGGYVNLSVRVRQIVTKRMEEPKVENHQSPFINNYNWKTFKNFNASEKEINANEEECVKDEKFNKIGTILEMNPVNFWCNIQKEFKAEVNHFKFRIQEINTKINYKKMQLTCNHILKINSSLDNLNGKILDSNDNLEEQNIVQIYSDESLMDRNESFKSAQNKNKLTLEEQLENDDDSNSISTTKEFPHSYAQVVENHVHNSNMTLVDKFTDDDNDLLHIPQLLVEISDFQASLNQLQQHLTFCETNKQIENTAMDSDILSGQKVEGQTFLSTKEKIDLLKSITRSQKIARLQKTIKSLQTKLAEQERQHEKELVELREKYRSEKSINVEFNHSDQCQTIRTVGNKSIYSRQSQGMKFSVYTPFLTPLNYGLD